MGESGDQVVGDKSLQSLRDQVAPPGPASSGPTLDFCGPGFPAPSQPRTPAPGAHPSPQTPYLSNVQVLHRLGDVGILDGAGEGQAQGEQEALHGCSWGRASELCREWRAETAGSGPYTGGVPASQPRPGPQPRGSRNPTWLIPGPRGGFLYEDNRRPSSIRGQAGSPPLGLDGSW